MSDFVEAAKILIICFGGVNDKGARVMMCSSIYISKVDDCG
jgi:hypothetical protein